MLPKGNEQECKSKLSLPYDWCIREPATVQAHPYDAVVYVIPLGYSVLHLALRVSLICVRMVKSRSLTRVEQFHYSNDTPPPPPPTTTIIIIIKIIIIIIIITTTTTTTTTRRSKSCHDLLIIKMLLCYSSSEMGRLPKASLAVERKASFSPSTGDGG